MIITYEIFLKVIRFRRWMLNTCDTQNLTMQRAVANEDLACLVKHGVITDDDHERLNNEFQEIINKRLQSAA